MEIQPIETERLILRKLEASDAERLFLLDKNAEVMKYLGVKTINDIAETEKNINFIQNQYQENGIGRFAVIEKSSGLLIGWAGLKFITEPINNHNRFYDLGYRFLPEFWGKGYATESAKAWLRYGFEKKNLHEIFAHAHSENHASNHTIRKLGFEAKGTFIDELDGAECYWYELKKEKFIN